jgi:hypothetical protein
MKQRVAGVAIAGREKAEIKVVRVRAERILFMTSSD